MKNKGTGGNVRARGSIAVASLLLLVAAAGLPLPAAAAGQGNYGLDWLVRTASCKTLVVYQFKNASVFLLISPVDPKKHLGHATACGLKERKALDGLARETDKLVLQFDGNLPINPGCRVTDEKTGAAQQQAVDKAFANTPPPCGGPLVAEIAGGSKLL